MLERDTPLRVVKVTRTCEACGEGEMLATDLVLTSNPLQYPHRCNKCGARQTFMKSYPAIEYREQPEAS